MTTKVHYYASIVLILLEAEFADTTFSAPTAKATQDKKHPFVQHLEKLYARLADTEQKGDIYAYPALRPKYIVDTTRSLLADKEMEKKFPAMLSKAEKTRKSLGEYEFVRCNVGSDMARLAYFRDMHDEDVEFYFLMHHLENGVWKIGKTKHRYVTDKSEDASPEGLDALLAKPVPDISLK